MKNALFMSRYAIMFIALFCIQGIIEAQPSGLCNNIQKCNDENFRASESDDLHAGEFYNTLGTNQTSVVYSEYTGGVPANFDYAYKAYFGKSNPADWYGVAARFEAGFCAIESFALSDGTDQGYSFVDYYGIRTGAFGGGANSYNFGTYSDAQGSDATAMNFGIYADAYGMGTNFAGYFNGDVVVTGTMSMPSDFNLKKNSKNLNGSLATLAQLHAKSYEYKNDKYGFMQLPSGIQYGFIAQDLEKVYPHLVTNNVHVASSTRHEVGAPKHNEVRYKAINYMGLIPIVVNAVNEQTEIIEQKEERITTLENQVNTLMERLALLEANIKSNQHILNGAGSASLQQNRPNPAKGVTVIDCQVNKDNSKLIIRNINGKIIDSIDNLREGNHSIQLKTNSYASGTYTYSLYNDLNLVDTKIMLIE